MSGLLNWPPSKGPNPHERRLIYASGAVGRKDLPRERVMNAAVVEKSLIAEVESGDMKAGVPTTVAGGPFVIYDGKKPLVKKPLVGSWKVNYRVVTVATLTLEQAVRLLWAVRQKPDEREFDNWWDFETRSLHVDITYPLATGVRLVVPPMTSTLERGDKKYEPNLKMCSGYFMWVVAKEYERIYAEHEKYGVWGHAIGDLYFERIMVREDGVVNLGIGS